MVHKELAEIASRTCPPHPPRLRLHTTTFNPSPPTRMVARLLRPSAVIAWAPTYTTRAWHKLYDDEEGPSEGVSKVIRRMFRVATASVIQELDTRPLHLTWLCTFLPARDHFCETRAPPCPRGSFEGSRIQRCCRSTR